MFAPDDIRRLINRFDEHRDDYRSGKYNETKVRREFIDPMFTALGWDVDDSQDYAEAHKEVVHEEIVGVAIKQAVSRTRRGDDSISFAEARIFQ